MSLLMGDSRYSLRKEFTGDYHDRPGLMAGQMWVVRFCGEFVAACGSREDGVRAVAGHQSERRREAQETQERILAALIGIPHTTTV